MAIFDVSPYRFMPNQGFVLPVVETQTQSLFVRDVPSRRRRAVFVEATMTNFVFNAYIAGLAQEEHLWPVIYGDDSIAWVVPDDLRDIPDLEEDLRN